VKLLVIQLLYLVKVYIIEVAEVLILSKIDCIVAVCLGTAK